MVFAQKMALFRQLFFLGGGNISQQNDIYDILEAKTPFYAIKTKSSKS